MLLSGMTVEWTTPLRGSPANDALESRLQPAFPPEGGTPTSSPRKDEPFDFDRVRQLFEKAQKGGKLTKDEQQYLERAREAIKRGIGPKRKELSSVGLKPLSEMTALDRYKGEDGGLYGGGKNEPPPTHLAAALKEAKEIIPRDAQGQPSKDGKIGLLAIGMSNTGGAFSSFQELADREPKKSPQVVLVNGAVSAGAESWARNAEGVWSTVAQRLKDAGVAPEQVQVAWIKQAEPGPNPDAVPLEYAKKLHTNLRAIVRLAKGRYPNLRLAYLSSRIYGGYNAAGLRLVNPEPFAYESAFSVRWLIQEQIKGDTRLNHDPKKGAIVAPVLLWGPYLWADGIKARKDGLVWQRQDLGPDGVHPSASGRQKSGTLLLNFFRTDATAQGWFLKK
jgi:hypothetical protein